MGNNWPDQESEYYKKSDMPLAAYLLFRGYVLINIVPESNESRKLFFQFANRVGLDINQIADDFQARKLTVEPCEYYYKIKEIKTRINYYVKNSGGQKRPVTSW